MLKVITPKQFKTIPWKNGLGETTELAINEGGNLDLFDWRISIASVVSDGVFSDFSGYDRNLVLIEGNGICLTHDDDVKDNLIKLLDVASFSGGCKTVGTLTQGAIKDFNIITSQTSISPQVQCLSNEQTIDINVSASSLCFAYSLTTEMRVEADSFDGIVVPTGSLLQIDYSQTESAYKLCGSNMIIIKLIKNS